MAEELTRDGHDFDPVTDVCSRCDSEGCRTLTGVTCVEELVRQLASERKIHATLYEKLKQTQAERDTYKRGFENASDDLDAQINSDAEIEFERNALREALRDVIVMRGADCDLWGKEWGDWIRKNDDLFKNLLKGSG